VGGDYNKSNYNRWSVRSNSTHIIFEDKTRNFLNKVKVGVNIGYSRSTGSSIDANTEYGSILGSALTFSPLVPVYADEETSAAILAKYPNAVTVKRKPSSHHPLKVDNANRGFSIKTDRRQ
jgi:hypothetical protein